MPKQITQLQLGSLIVKLQELGARLALDGDQSVGHIRPADSATTTEGYRTLIRLREDLSLDALDGDAVSLIIKRLGNLAERLETGEALSESRITAGDWRIPATAALYLMSVQTGIAEVEQPLLTGFLAAALAGQYHQAGGCHA